MVLDFKGEGAIDMRMRKQMFGRQMFAGSAETIGQRGILTDLLVSSLSTHLVPTVVSYDEGDTAPGLHLHFLSS